MITLLADSIGPSYLSEMSYWFSKWLQRCSLSKWCTLWLLESKFDLLSNFVSHAGLGRESPINCSITWTDPWTMWKFNWVSSGWRYLCPISTDTQAILTVHIASWVPSMILLLTAYPLRWALIMFRILWSIFSDVHNHWAFQMVVADTKQSMQSKGLTRALFLGSIEPLVVNLC